MKCKFCNKDMISQIRFFGGADREIIRCKNHKPINVFYKITSRGEEKWFVSNGEYRLVYWNDKAVLQKCHPEASARDYYQIIKKFDYEPPFLPEEFSNKLKTILTFL